MMDDVKGRIMRLREAIPVKEQELLSKEARLSALNVEVEQFHMEEDKLKSKKTKCSVVIWFLAILTVFGFYIALQRVDFFVIWSVAAAVACIIVSILYAVIDKKIQPYLDQAGVEVIEVQKKVSEVEEEIKQTKKTIAHFKEELHKLEEMK